MITIDLDSIAYGGSGVSPPVYEYNYLVHSYYKYNYLVHSYYGYKYLVSLGHGYKYLVSLRASGHKKTPSRGGHQVHRMIAPQVPGLPRSRLAAEVSISAHDSIIVTMTAAVMSIYTHPYVKNYNSSLLGINTYHLPLGINTYCLPLGINTYSASLGINTHSTFVLGINTYRLSLGINTYCSLLGINTYSTFVLSINTYSTPVLGINTYSTPVLGINTYRSPLGINTYDSCGVPVRYITSLSFVTVVHLYYGYFYSVRMY